MPPTPRVYTTEITRPESRITRGTSRWGSRISSPAELMSQWRGVSHARLDGNGTRGRRRLGKLIDDSQAHPQPCEPQRQHQARRSCPDDEDVGLTNQ